MSETPRHIPQTMAGLVGFLEGTLNGLCEFFEEMLTSMQGNGGGPTIGRMKFYLTDIRETLAISEEAFEQIIARNARERVYGKHDTGNIAGADGPAVPDDAASPR